MTVRLPAVAAPVEPTTQMATTQTATKATTTALRVLLVDDNHDHAEILNELLQVWGHDVVVAHDGDAVLQLATEERFDVALLDIGLPGKDGYQIASSLQTSPNKPVLVALTGYGGERDRQRSKDAGFDHHLVKPPDIDALSRLLVDIGRQLKG